LKVWCSCPARAALRFAGKGIELAEPTKHRYGAGHKIASAWPYNVAQLYAMLGESIRNGKKEPLLRWRDTEPPVDRCNRSCLAYSFWRSPMIAIREEFQGTGLIRSSRYRYTDTGHELSPGSVITRVRSWWSKDVRQMSAIGTEETIDRAGGLIACWGEADPL
jgi:hypothetical protein